MIGTTYLLLGIIILYFSGEYLVSGSVALAKHLRVQPFIIALTLVAFGTSAPELAISINSALKGLQGITLGNIVGSNIANVLFAVPLAFLIKISKKSDVRTKDSIFLVILTLIFSTIIFLEKNLELIFGVFSLLLLISYIFLIIYEAKAEKRKVYISEEDQINLSALKASFFEKNIFSPRSLLTKTTLSFSISLGPTSIRKGTPFISHSLNLYPGVLLVQST